MDILDSVEHIETEQWFCYAFLNDRSLSQRSSSGQYNVEQNRSVKSKTTKYDLLFFKNMNKNSFYFRCYEIHYMYMSPNYTPLRFFTVSYSLHKHGFFSIM